MQAKVAENRALLVNAKAQVLLAMTPQWKF